MGEVVVKLDMVVKLIHSYEVTSVNDKFLLATANSFNSLNNLPSGTPIKL